MERIATRYTVECYMAGVKEEVITHIDSVAGRHEITSRRQAEGQAIDWASGGPNRAGIVVRRPNAGPADIVFTASSNLDGHVTTTETWAQRHNRLHGKAATP